MAGMLPGVESARRRRCHGTGAGWPDSQSSSIFESSSCSRRSSLCLYTSNHSSQSNLLQNKSQNRTVNKYQQQHEQEEDEKLGGAAREAKERLDERLRSQYNKLEPKRRNSTGRISSSHVVEGRTTMRDEVRNQEASAGLRRSSSSSSKRLMMSWAKLRSWKSSDQEECAVCLEHFRSSEDLSFLPCAHRFHSKCLLPWLQNNAHCPCCRNPI